MSIKYVKHIIMFNINTMSRLSKFIGRHIGPSSSEVGNMFLNMFNNADQLFRTASDSMYQKVDDLLGAAKTKPALSIFQKAGTRNSLDETVKTLQENIQRVKIYLELFRYHL